MLFFIFKSSAFWFLSWNLMRFFKCIGFHDKTKNALYLVMGGGGVEGYPKEKKQKKGQTPLISV